jgi:two-component system sensor kinase FixL
VPRRLASILLPTTAVAFAILIFVVDTVTPLEVTIAVLYVIVILIAGGLCDRRGLLFMSAGCIAMTLLSFILQHGTTYASQSFTRCVMSVLVIVVTTGLAAKNQSASKRLREQSRLLDLTHDSIVRDTNDVTTYWNRGAEELYEWRSSQAIGRG